MAMFTKIIELCKNGTKADLQYFLLGCMAMLALWIILMLLRYFLMFLFREHRCKNLTIKSNSGDVNISAKAIFEVINSLRSEFKFIDIEKISMSETGGKYNFNINLMVNLASQQLPAFVENYKSRIMELLESKFGVRNVKYIRINVKNIQLNYADSSNRFGEIPPTPAVEAKVAEKKVEDLFQKSEKGKIEIKDSFLANSTDKEDEGKN